MSKMCKILVLLCFLLLPDVAGAQSAVRISGNVINNNRPVADASVSLLYSCRSCSETLILVTTTGDDGYFSMDGDFLMLENIRMFIEEKPPEKFWNPLQPADFFLPKLSRFRGVKVHIPKSGLANLGDITSTVRYREILVDLSKVFSTHLLRTESKNTFKLAIVHKNQKIKDNISIPEKALSEMMLKLALPVGENWTLKISFIDGKKMAYKKVLVKLDHTQKVIYQKKLVRQNKSAARNMSAGNIVTRQN